jgi:hypothetical protein
MQPLREVPHRAVSRPDLVNSNMRLTDHCYYIIRNVTAGFPLSIIFVQL